MVTAIADYRAAREAMRIYRQGAKGIKQFQDAPALLDMLVAMAKAQQPAADEGTLFGAMQQMRTDETDGE